MCQQSGRTWYFWVVDAPQAPLCDPRLKEAQMLEDGRVEQRGNCHLSPRQQSQGFHTALSSCDVLMKGWEEAPGLGLTPWPPPCVRQEVTFEQSGVLPFSCCCYGNTVGFSHMGTECLEFQGNIQDWKVHPAAMSTKTMEETSLWMFLRLFLLCYLITVLQLQSPGSELISIFSPA